MKLLGDLGIHSWEDAAAVVAVLAFVGAFLRWSTRRAVKTVISDQLSEVRRELVKRTEQIQPDSNGGNSLPDLHKQVGELRTALLSIDDTVDRVELGTRANNRDITTLAERFDSHLEDAAHAVAEAERAREEHVAEYHTKAREEDA